LHGLDGVEHEVQDGLLEVCGVEGGGEGCGVEVQAHADALVLGLGGEEVGEFFDDAVEVGGFRVQAEFAGVGEKVGEDAAEAFGFAAEAVEAAEQSLAGVLGRGLVLGEVFDAFGEELGVEADGAERVLDLVGEAAGHLAQFGEAFGGAGAAFGGELLGEDAADEDARDDGGKGGAEDEAEGEVDKGGHEVGG
jgi:hypothetical protein